MPTLSKVSPTPNCITPGVKPSSLCLWRRFSIQTIEHRSVEVISLGIQCILSYCSRSPDSQMRKSSFSLSSSLITAQALSRQVSFARNSFQAEAEDFFFFFFFLFASVLLETEKSILCISRSKGRQVYLISFHLQKCLLGRKS